MSIVSSYFSSYRTRRPSSSSRSSSSGFIDVNSIMDTLTSILAGLALRFVVDRIGGNENRLTGTLVGLWEGVVLQHFMNKSKKKSRSSRSSSRSASRSSSSRSATPPYEAYIAYAIRLFIDYVLTESFMRVMLIALWTGLGVVMAEIAPTLWRDLGMKRFWRRFRRDMYYFQRSLPPMPNIDVSLPWGNDNSYYDSRYSSRPIGTRTTTVRFSPSEEPSEVSVITSTTQPPPLISGFSSRFVPRASRRPVPGAFPGDTISEIGTEVTATTPTPTIRSILRSPGDSSVGLRSPGAYSDISTESSARPPARGGLFGSTFNAFSFFTGGPKRRTSYPTSDGADDDDRSTASASASNFNHSIGTSLHNPAEIPDEDDSDTETEISRAAEILRRARAKGKSRAFIDDDEFGLESTPNNPDLVLPTPSESGIFPPPHPSRLPLASTTANPDYLSAGPALDERPPPSAEIPLIPNNEEDEEWEKISKGGSSEGAQPVPPPPGQTSIPQRVPPDSSFDYTQPQDPAQDAAEEPPADPAGDDDELEYMDEEPAPPPINRPNITFTYQVAPVPLPVASPDLSYVASPLPADPLSPPPTNNALGVLPREEPGIPSEFGEISQPVGQILGLGRGKKKGGSVMDYDYGAAPWNPTGGQRSTLGAGSSFTGSGVVPPPAPAPEFYTSGGSVVGDQTDPATVAGATIRPPTAHSRRQSVDQPLNRRESVGSLSGVRRAATELGIGGNSRSTPAPRDRTSAIPSPAPAQTSAPATKPPSAAQTAPPSRPPSTAPVPPVTGAGSKRGSRQASRQASAENLKEKEREAAERARLEAEEKAREAEEKKAREAEEKARKEAEEKERKEAEKKAKAEEKKKAKEEAERKAKEEEARKAKEEERKAKEEEEARKAKEEEEARKAKEEEERKAKEEADKLEKATKKKKGKKAQSEIGTGTTTMQPPKKGTEKVEQTQDTSPDQSRQSSRQQSREPSVDPIGRKAMTEIGAPSADPKKKRGSGLFGSFFSSDKDKEEDKGGKNERSRPGSVIGDTAASLFGGAGKQSTFDFMNTGAGNRLSRDLGWGEGELGNSSSKNTPNTGDLFDFGEGNAWNHGGNAGADGNLVDLDDTGAQPEAQTGPTEEEPPAEPATPEVALSALPTGPNKRWDTVMSHKKEMLKSAQKIADLEKQFSEAITPATKSELQGEIMAEKANQKGLNKVGKFWLTDSFSGTSNADSVDLSDSGSSSLKLLKDALMLAMLEDQPVLKVKFAQATKGGASQKSSAIAHLNKYSIKFEVKGLRDMIVTLQTTTSS